MHKENSLLVIKYILIAFGILLMGASVYADFKTHHELDWLQFLFAIGAGTFIAGLFPYHE